MSEAKTRPTPADPAAFVAAVDHPGRRTDGERLLDLFAEVSGQAATMWGPSIIGFGSYHYRYDSGHEGDAPRIAFSPRKANLVLYVGGYPDYEADLARLGKHKSGKACLYLNRLADVDETVLRHIVRQSWHASASGGSC